MFVAERSFALGTPCVDACISTKHGRIFAANSRFGVVVYASDTGEILALLSQVPRHPQVELKGDWKGVCLTPDEDTLIVTTQNGVYEVNHVGAAEPKFLWAPNSSADEFAVKSADPACEFTVESAACNDRIVAVLYNTCDIVIIDRSATRVIASLRKIDCYVGSSLLIHVPAYPHFSEEEIFGGEDQPRFVEDIRCLRDSEEVALVTRNLDLHTVYISTLSPVKGVLNRVAVVLPSEDDSDFTGCIQGSNPNQYTLLDESDGNTARVRRVSKLDKSCTEEDTGLLNVESMSNLSGDRFVVLDDYGKRLTVYRDDFIRSELVCACVALSMLQS